MTTPQEFLPPRELPADGWIAALRAVLDERPDIVRAYYVTARFLEDGSLQDELHLELAEPPIDAAPNELFMELADVLPSPYLFTFPTRAILPRVREAGALLWSREPGQ